MNDAEITECRKRLTEAVWDAFDSCTCGRSSHLSICPASEYESIQTTLDKLIKFSQLVALAHQPCQWWFEADGRCASVDAAGRCGACESAAELAEIVTAVLMAEVTT